MFVGNFNNTPCFISQNAPNLSVCLTGISGSGKTVRMQKIELEYVKNGGTVLVVDTTQTHVENQIFPCLREEYDKFINRIDALEDGLYIPLLTPLTNIRGESESFVNLINMVVNALTAGQNLGVQQIGVLRSAIMEAIQNRSRFQTDVEAITYFLLRSEDKRASAVYQRLWTVLNSGVLRPSVRNVECGKINIIDLSSVDCLSKSTMTEILLSAIWRSVAYSGINNEVPGLLLCLDEFQNLSWKREAIARNILREGRKFGISVVMATQTLSVFSRDVVALLNQTATNLIFRPPLNEIFRIAKAIQPTKYEKWVSELNNLHVGECIAVGNLRVENHEISHPIRLS